MVTPFIPSKGSTISIFLKEKYKRAKKSSEIKGNPIMIIMEKSSSYTLRVNFHNFRYTKISRVKGQYMNSIITYQLSRTILTLWIVFLQKQQEARILMKPANVADSDRGSNYRSPDINMRIKDWRRKKTPSYRMKNFEENLVWYFE